MNELSQIPYRANEIFLVEGEYVYVNMDWRMKPFIIDGDCYYFYSVRISTWDDRKGKVVYFHNRKKAYEYWRFIVSEMKKKEKKIREEKNE